jgi:hypothetical protein
MEIVKKKHYSSSSPIEQQNVTAFWCSDGWCYIPEKKIRRKFQYNKKMIYTSETWDGIIPIPSYVEKIEWITYSPLLWQEKSTEFSEFYEIVSSNPNTKTHSCQE